MAKRNGRGISRMHFKDASVNDMTTHFNYPEVVGKHYDYCGCVDDHNNKRQDGGIKEGLALEVHGTPCVGQFVCFISFSQPISEVNCFIWHGSISRARRLNFWPSARNWPMNPFTILILRMGSIHRRQEAKESDLMII
jgi:hypothetical protein